MLIWGTELASTCKSGSDTVTATPKRKLTIKMRGRFFDLVRAAPIRTPMGLMELSAPTVNNPMPATTNKDPTRKDSICPVGSGVTNKHSKHTMIRMGSTELMLSSTLSMMMAFCRWNSFIAFTVYHRLNKKDSTCRR